MDMISLKEKTLWILINGDLLHIANISPNLFPEKALETVQLNDFQEVVSQADVQD